MLGTAEVPAAVFAEFLEANPRWRAEGREALVSEGLATNDYLAAEGGPGQGGISSVSWFAAQAFCEWLSGKLPPALAAYEVRLPTEAEWEYAATSVKRWAAAGNAEAAIIKHIADSGAASGAWEWCADPYAPLGFFNAAPEAVAAIGSPERAVRGGSALNPPGSVSAETRASLPPALCSPFVSFRAVIAPKD
jgi:formylglycine-generating enzyme required for sulfatase activity